MSEASNERIVASFQTAEDARRARDRLVDAGYAERDVRLVENPRSLEGATDARTAEPARHEEHRSFWQRLFGFEDDAREPVRDDARMRSSDFVFDGSDERYAEGDRYFKDVYERGAHLVIIDRIAADRRTDAETLLRQVGAEIEPRAGGWLGDRLESEPVKSVLLRAEELTTKRREVQAGEVRVRKEVVTETRTVEVPVEREEVVIERRPVAPGEATAETSGSLDASNLRDGEEIRIPLTEEEVTIEKKVVPKEEVRVGKEKIRETRQVSEDVRHEEARIERSGDASIRGEREKEPEIAARPRTARAKPEERPTP